MGYYTDFDLEVLNSQEFSYEEIIAASYKLCEITNLYDSDDVKEYCKNYSDPFGWLTTDSWKWYDCEEDMIKLGKLFPEMCFCLSGNGEDRDDNWRLFIKGDKIERQEARIVFDPAPDWSYN